MITKATVPYGALQKIESVLKIILSVITKDHHHAHYE